MTITLTNPQSLPRVDFHRQVSIATGSKLVFMAGQVAWDADGTLVGEGDLAAQVEQCYLNVGAALAEIGGSLDDIAKMTIYVVDWTVDKMPMLQQGRAQACAKLGIDTFLPPGTLIGVGALFMPQILVEVEAIAVLD
ncbi:RidA family protein [Mycolicibacterium aubagnense]|uniref:Enamine deaminase RidA n=1 Tax=Mycolicibacterium aubagnense TaxID=319707 RepID=A0ABM7I8T6_9MYCO|nr:RidA family protein [Mycolicibacterium aubagnense]TLH61090.1 enamine deaminase RidA [Mycolicibacterium aubagnense]WGI35034.1 RidA family protein [Mycolicibacterium aubagnense]BBX83036.1 enamine deaminase RidA [Mycolicibacterium aubagnense]